MNIQRIDHLVLTVKNIQKSCDFYKKIMGMRIVEFDGGRWALSFGNQKINLHQQGNEFEPKAGQPTAGAADICFITGTGLSNVIARLEKYKIAIIEGPVRRTGATGPLLSVYFRDPDHNLIEVASRTDQAEGETTHEP